MTMDTQKHHLGNVPLSHTSAVGFEPIPGDRIYTDFFNLRGAPFSITPDPEFLFLSETHRNVIEKIQYGIQTRMGFMLLSGEVGTGKTTICRALLDHLQDTVRTVYVINPSLTGQELLAGILDDLGISYSHGATKKELMDLLNQCLLDDDALIPVVIIVDDAQTMPLATLEDLRLLSNLETDKSKLLQMLLVGQPELLTNLDQPQMRQLKQRVAVSCHLDYLSCDEVGGYIERRLFIAGNQGQLRFSSKAIYHIHRQSGGVPRMINKICDLALTAAYAANSNVVERCHLKAAANELIELQGIHGKSTFGHQFQKERLWKGTMITVGFMVAMIIGFFTHDDIEKRFDYAKVQKDRTKVSFQSDFEDHDQIKISDASGSGQSLVSLSPDEYKAYILQLGSFNTLATTLRAADIYTRKGINVHWNMVQLGKRGLWYRVFAGRFSSIESARLYQREMGVADAQILFAPWAVVLDQSGTPEHINSVKAQLKFQGVDSYFALARNGFSHLCAGAFISQNRAEEVARLIRSQTGVTTNLLNFHPALVSGSSVNREDSGGEQS